jgi:transcriptional regulator with XRE-family HTH domain
VKTTPLSVRHSPVNRNPTGDEARWMGLAAGFAVIIMTSLERQGALMVEQETIATLARAVRRYRSERGWSIDQLVGHAGVSKGAIVALENGTTNPSLGTIVRLADALGVSITDLLEDRHSGRIKVITPTDYRQLWHGEAGGEAFLIETVSSASPVELWHWRLPAGERYEGPPHPAGFRESIIVLSGTLELTVGADVRHVEAGSTAVFEADLPHAYAAADVTEFLMLVHLSPPLGAVVHLPGEVQVTDSR